MSTRFGTHFYTVLQKRAGGAEVAHLDKVPFQKNMLNRRLKHPFPQKDIDYKSNTATV